MLDKQTIRKIDGKPLVSFIIPVYNVPPAMVSECLQSILSLSLTPAEREIVVIDDGSDEPVCDQLKDFANDIVGIRTENCGLAATRNRGLEMARGEFIQFVDADDRLVTDAYNHCLARIRQNDIDLLQFRLTTQKQTGQTARFSTPVSGTDHMTRHNLRSSACGYLVRRSTIGHLRFSNTICEDELFTPLLMLQAQRVSETQTEAYFYRQRTGSIMHPQDIGEKHQRLAHTQAIIARLSRHSQLLESRQQAALQRRVAQLTMDLIYNTWRDRDTRNSLSNTLQTLRADKLFPLPLHFYTHKYFLFALASRCCCRP